MNKTFSKSYIIPPLKLTLDYIVLNYCFLDTICFTYPEDNIIKVTSLHNKRLNASNISAQLNQYNEKMSTSTVQRRLREADLYGRITVKKLLLRKQRLWWTKKHKDWTIQSQILDWQIKIWNLWVKEESLCAAKNW